MKKLEKKRQDALQQTLAAWLNFAKGTIDWDEDIVVDPGTGTGSKSRSGSGSSRGTRPSTPPVVMDFSDLIAEVEAILNNPLSTAEDFEHAKDLAESVNKHDKDNPDCDTGTGSGSNSGSGSGSGSGTGSKSSKGGDDSGSGTGSKSSKDNKKNKGGDDSGSGDGSKSSKDNKKNKGGKKGKK
jgi:hypothetical protein